MAIQNASLHEWDLRGLSTDPNPSEEEAKVFPDGISLFEKDTRKVFFFDKPNNQWLGKNGEVRS